jgi:ParB family chromosome partitioning protein
MAEQVALLDPDKLRRNPENPRLIFRAGDLAELEDSIKSQGILVPLTVYEDGKVYRLLDGERRWRCAIKLGLARVPAVVQPKPERLQNIMMMFAIHNARTDWDPLPTALKLEELEVVFTERQERPPTERELAQMASMSRGEVRRLRNLLALPHSYREELLDELEKPKSEQRLTVDHVLETTRGVSALQKRGVIAEDEEDPLRRAIVDKFKSGVVNNTVAPRKLARIARAVERGEVSRSAARRVTTKLVQQPSYTIDQAFEASVEQVDFEHGTEQLAYRVVERLREHADREYEVGDALREALEDLAKAIRRTLG